MKEKVIEGAAIEECSDQGRQRLMEAAIEGDSNRRRQQSKGKVIEGKSD